MSQASSQQSLVTEVATWSIGKCEEEIYTIVPKLLEGISHSPHNLDGLLKSSYILAERFLTSTFQEDLGTRILDTIFSQLLLAFDNTLSRLPCENSSAAVLSQETPATVTGNLQDTIKILQCLDSIIHQVAVVITGAITTVKLTDISKVPDITILILDKSYSHCKTSEKIYGEFFKHTSKSLGVLFQKTYGLQKTFSSMLGNIKSSPEVILCMGKTKGSAVKICEGLLCICQTVSGMDNLLLGSAWKLLMTFLSEFQDLIKSELRPEPYLNLLQESALQCVKYSMQLLDRSSHLLLSGNEPTKKALFQSSKFSSFFISSLCELLKVFRGCLNDNAHSGMVSFFCKLHIALKPRQLSPHENQIPDEAVKIQSEILPTFSGYETATKLLVSEESFINFFLQLDQIEKYKQRYGFVQMLLSMCSALTKDVSILQKWFISYDDRVPVIFLMKFAVEQAYTARECLNTLVYHAGVPHSLYDSLIIHLCALLSCLSSELFKLVESELIFSDLFSHDPLRSILACDILVFVCSASKSLCKHYATIFSEMLRACAGATQLSFPFQVVMWTLRRIKCPETSFTRDENHCTWAALPLPLDTAQSSLGTVLPDACRKMQEAIGISSVDILHLSRATQQCLRILPCAVAIHGQKLQPCHRNIVKDTQANLMKLWFRFCDGTVPFNDSICSSKFLATFFRTLKIFLVELDPQDSGKMMNSICKLLENAISPVIKIEIIEIMSKLAANSIENVDQQCAVFMNLIQDSDWRVRCSAFRAFEVISCHASGTQMLQKCAAIPDIAAKMEEHFSFSCADSIHDGNYIAEQQKMFASMSTEDLYESWQSQQNQTLKKFVANYKVQLAEMRKDNDTSVVNAFARVQESVSELDRLCASRKITRDDIDSSAIESLKISSTLLHNLSKKFGV